MAAARNPTPPNKKDGYNPKECALYREGFEKDIENLGERLDTEVDNLADQLNRVERNLLDALKQASRVAELASNGYKDTLNTTLKSLHENFERGNERFRAQENRTAKLTQDLQTMLNELQRTKLEVQFIVTHKEQLKELLAGSHIDGVVKGLKGEVKEEVSKLTKLVYRLGVLFIVGFILLAVYEGNEHSLSETWETLLKIIF